MPLDLLIGGCVREKKNLSGLLFEGDDVLCWQPAQYPFLQLGEIERPPLASPRFNFAAHNSGRYFFLLFLN